MKKSILALSISLLSLVGCQTDSPNHTVIYLLTKMESVSALEGVAPKTSTYTFRQVTGTPPDPKNPYRFSNYPEVVRQEITGDTLTHIDYSYNIEKQSITARRYHTNGQVFTDSLGLNSSGMAATVLREGSTPTPYSISYAQHGKSLRTMVGKTTLTTETDPYNYGGSIYRSATVGGMVVAEYHYEQIPNFIQLQQHTIPGAPYYWATDRFGGQSAYLLQYSEVVEQGVKVRYDFSYIPNNAGFVSQEFIKRDKIPYMTNTYHYAQGIVEW